ncbi:MAG: hypothetical protein JWM31_2167 [Solirubrobacterales bacterium]|nr:hypothetical protein [Solirubrobacterales bacterium]
MSTNHLATYVDRISALIVDRWTTVVQSAALAGRRREATVRALLAGEEIDPADLDHPLDRQQLVFAIKPAMPGAPRAAALIRQLAAALGGPAEISLETAGGATLAWLAPAPSEHGAVDRLLALVPAGLWCAAALAGPGLDEFLDGARNAREALDVIQRTHPDGHTTMHTDIALLGTLLGDERSARRFVRAVLGPLADDSDRSRQLRDTLRAYTQAGGRKSGAAGLLGLHEKTVAYRLRNAETALGGPDRAYRPDVIAALLVHTALHTTESQTS